MKPAGKSAERAWDAPFTAAGLLRVAALVGVITLAPMVLWLSVGLQPVARASGADVGWQQIWAHYGSSVEYALRLACACTAAVMLLVVPCALAVLQSRAAWLAAAGRLLQRPVAVPALAAALAPVLVLTPSQGPLPDFVILLMAHVTLTLPFAVRVITAAMGNPAQVASVQAGAASLTGATISACLLAFALSLGQSSLTSLLSPPFALLQAAGLAPPHGEAGNACTAMVVAVAMPLLWGMGVIAEALGLCPLKSSWADRS